MQTLHPVVLRGRTGGAAEALAPDELADRLAALQRRIAARGLAGLAVYGDSRDYAALCYVSGYIPMVRWAVVLVPADGDPALFLATPGRDLDHTRTLTRVADVRPIAALADAIGELAARGHASVGLAGSPRIRASVHGRIHAGGHVVDMPEELVGEQMRVPRPREVELLRAAAVLTARAADVAADADEQGRSATDALLVAELWAREQGAHDVRALYSPDGGRTLRPFETIVDDGRPDPLVFYLAVELDGYWGEAFRTAGADLEEARGRLDAAARDVATRRDAREVAQRLAGAPPHPALGGGRTIARMGLARDERVTVLTPGVYSLRAGTLGPDRGVLLSRTVALADGGLEDLA